MRRAVLAAALLALLGCGSAARPLPSFQRGVTLAHELSRKNEGYGSEAAFKQLARLKELGVNSVTLVPYGFTRAPEDTDVRWRGSDETDERVTGTLREARRLGLTTVLKPQLWARRWTGDIVFTDDEAFRLWMSSYRAFILHYARMAELEQADLLVVGTELGGLTLPREADWRALFREVRTVYTGPLTYAANWGREFESLGFWDELDFLGVNFYYPLAAPGEQPRAGSPRLKELERMLEEMSRKHRKPVLFTEVGYAASAAAAAEPWKEHNAPLDPEMQARCYEVIFQSFYGKRWLAGLHWWKWPSHGRGGMDDPSFSPLGKPALGVLERWYGNGAR